MGKRRGAPEKASVRKIIKAIPGTNGLISAIAIKLGVHYRTVLRYRDQNESVRQAIEEEKEKMLDTAESNIHREIQKGDMDTSKWFLARKGKDRGYSEKIDTEHKGELKTILEVKYEENVKATKDGED